MAIGFKRKRGEEEYIFIDGQAIRNDEALRIDLNASVPGQKESQEERKNSEGFVSKTKQTLKEMDNDDAFALRSDVSQQPHRGELMAADKAQLRTKVLACGIALLVIALFSLCISKGFHYTVYSPFDVVACYGQWFHLTAVQLGDPAGYAQARAEVLAQYPMYTDVLAQFLQVLKMLCCGTLLAVSGMLYQNTFRNPIAAPSMLGVSSGVNLALLLMVMLFGVATRQNLGMYYVLSYLGGAAILLLVIFGGKFISGTGKFNVVNMLLIGTILSQMAGTIITFVENNVFNESEWYEYYLLQTATNLETIWTFVTIAVTMVVTLVPVIVYRFRLNLVSFSDLETKMLGVDPNKLRIAALVIGSVMILTAQVNVGQVAMVSLIVPFIARAVFGAEFRKQLAGTVLIGSLVLLICGDLSTYIAIAGIPLDIGSIVTIVTLPLFVWMLAAQQRSWD